MARFETLFRDSTLEDSRLVARLLAVPPPRVCPSPRPRSVSREESANGVAPLASLQALNSFFIHSETFETKVSTSQRTSLARACKFASRVFYIDAYTRVKTCTRMHIYIQSFSAHWRRLYIAPLSEDIRACVDNKLASFHQSPSSFREPPSSLSLSLSTSESPLDRVQTQSLQARASRRFSLFDYIGLYHDPLGYYLLYRRDTCIHAHTYMHIHYFIRNERLVLSFVYSFAPSLCIV